MRSFLETTHRSVLWFKKAHDADELVLKPPFQRNPVWVTRQKSLLIDTILLGYPIPEIYMQDQISDDGEALYILVDGQQRIRTVLEYIEGRFAIDPSDSTTWGDFYFDDLSPDEKNTVRGYKFVVRILPEMDDAEIRLIFQRLNRNVLALNKQELRQATYWGPFISTMNSIANKRTWPKIGVFTQNDIRRMLDVELISEIAAFILHGPQDKKKNLDKYYRLYEEEFEQEDIVREVFDKVLLEITQTLPEISHTRWRKKTDFYTLFQVFSNHTGRLPLAREGRDQARILLLEFGEEIDHFVRSELDPNMEFSQTVRLYGSGIRASTDLGSRNRRFEALDNVLSDVWEGID